LKAGKKKIPHFAHRSHCPVSGKGETGAHLKGKRKLYQWLKRIQLEPRLEPFLSGIRQRPDLLVSISGKRIAIEYQYSAVEWRILEKRTRAYFREGITPLWIADARFFRGGKGMIPFNDFTGFFLQDYFGIPQMIAFDPDRECFLLFARPIPFSSRRAFVRFRRLPLMDSDLQVFAEDPVDDSFLAHWVAATERWLGRTIRGKDAIRHPFLIGLYRRHIHPFQLPEIVGVPLPDMHWVETPPMVWQGELWIRFLFGKGRGHSFGWTDVEQFVLSEMKNCIRFRHFSHLAGEKKILPIRWYFHFLSALGLLSVRGNTFRLEKPVEPLPISADRCLIRKDFFRRSKAKIMGIFLLTQRMGGYNGIANVPVSHHIGW